MHEKEFPFLRMQTYKFLSNKQVEEEKIVTTNTRNEYLYGHSSL